MGNEKVSVVMATFNEPVAYIEKAINSILNQTYKNLELLIADDSTSLVTCAVIDEIASKDNRVKVIRKDIRMGFVTALNYALEEASGEFIARMDGDDFACLDRFEKQINFFHDNDSVDICGGSLQFVDGEGNLNSVKKYPTTHNSIVRYFSYRCPIAHPTVMFRRRIVDAGFRYNPTYKKAEDLDFWLTLRNAGYMFANLSDVLLNYRVVGNLGAKRNHSQYLYGVRTYWKHLTLRYFAYDLFALLTRTVFCIVPLPIVSWFYNRESHKE